MQKIDQRKCVGKTEVHARLLRNTIGLQVEQLIWTLYPSCFKSQVLHDM